MDLYEILDDDCKRRFVQDNFDKRRSAYLLLDYQYCDDGFDLLDYQDLEEFFKTINELLFILAKDFSIIYLD